MELYSQNYTQVTKNVSDKKIRVVKEKKHFFLILLVFIFLVLKSMFYDLKKTCLF